MPYQQLRKITELFDREIGREGRLPSFFTNDTDAYICRLDHRHVVASVADAADTFLGEFAD
jgi:hypothetical protein